jgi:hypothetical protein
MIKSPLKEVSFLFKFFVEADPKKGLLDFIKYFGFNEIVV